MQATEDLIRNVVQEVLTRMDEAPPAAGTRSLQGRFGVFTCVNEAVRAATEAFEQLSERSLADRKRIIDHIRRISIDDCVELGTMEMNETKIGRLTHKIEKLKTLGEQTPGVEFMRSEVFSGDHGLAVIEHAPFGVIGAITPVTHSLPTITGNAVSMIAGGNTLVVNPHPSGKKRGCRRRAAVQRSHLSRPGHRQSDLRHRRADAGNGGGHFRPSRHQADLRHRRASRGSGGDEQRQTGHRGRAGQSAGRRRRNGRSRSGGSLDHPGRRLRQQFALHCREGSFRRRSKCSTPCSRRWTGPAGCGSTPAKSMR